MSNLQNLLDEEKSDFFSELKRHDLECEFRTSESAAELPRSSIHQVNYRVIVEHIPSGQKETFDGGHGRNWVSEAAKWSTLLAKNMQR
jgi:hypothetical protein